MLNLVTPSQDLYLGFPPTHARENLGEFGLEDEFTSVQNKVKVKYNPFPFYPFTQVSF